MCGHHTNNLIAYLHDIVLNTLWISINDSIGQSRALVDFGSRDVEKSAEEIFEKTSEFSKFYFFENFKILKY